MPLITPHKDESRKDFVSRCMGDDKMVSEFPDQSQRAAVCNRQFEKTYDESIPFENLQAIVFSKERFPTQEDVQFWLETREIKDYELQETFKQYVYVIKDSTKFVQNSFELYTVEGGVLAVSAIPKPIFSFKKNLEREKPISQATIGDWDEVLHGVKKTSILRQDINDFFKGYKYSELSKFTDGIPLYRANLYRFTIKHFLDNGFVKNITNYSYYDEDEHVPPVFSRFSTGDEMVEGLEKGVLWFEFENDQKIRLDFELSPYGLELTYLGTSKEIIEEFQESAETFIKENNFLKGKKLLANGAFINVPSLTWKDIIIEPQLKDKIYKNVVKYMERIDEFAEKGVPTKRGILLFGKPGCGKASANSSVIYTIDGPKKMRDILKGDMVIGSDGNPHKVLNVFPQGEKEIFKVTFTDGMTTRVTADHLWEVYTIDKTKKILSTQEILDSGLRKFTGISEKDGSEIYLHKYRIKTINTVNYENKEIPLDPYLLGLLIGDGSFRNNFIRFFNSEEFLIKEVINRIPEGDYISKHSSNEIAFNINGGTTKNIIKSLGLFDKLSLDKFIPDIYKYNSLDVRLSLLQGLMDTDGSNIGTNRKYSPSIFTSSEKLKNDIVELVQSLGCLCSVYKIESHSYNIKDKEDISKESWSINILYYPNEFELFKLPRKLYNLEKKTYDYSRKITSIESDGMEEATCILIDSEDHLYATDNFILTHNTMLGKVLFNELKDCTAIWVPYGASYKHVYDMARELAPSVVLLEDLASHGGFDRRQYAVDSGALSVLLNMLDGVEENDKILTLATENYIDNLDVALRNRPGRFDVLLKMDYPEVEQRIDLLHKLLPEFAMSRIQELAKFAEDMSFAHIRELATRLIIEESTPDEDMKVLKDLKETFGIGNDHSVNTI